MRECVSQFAKMAAFNEAYDEVVKLISSVVRSEEAAQSRTSIKLVPCKSSSQGDIVCTSPGVASCFVDKAKVGHHYKTAPDQLVHHTASVYVCIYVCVCVCVCCVCCVRISTRKKSYWNGYD